MFERPQGVPRHPLSGRIRAFWGSTVCPILLLVATLGGCATGGLGPAQLAYVDGDTTACVPGAVGEPVLVGDWLMVGNESEVVVTDVSFASSRGVKILERAIFRTDDGHGYTLYPLAALEDDDPGLWPSRVLVPSNQAAPLWEGTANGETLRQATVVALVARTGNDQGIMENLQVRYKSAGQVYTVSNRFT